MTSTLWFRVRAEAADVIAEASRDGQAWQQLRIAPLLERRVTASINKGRAAVRRGLSLASGTTMLAWREASEAASRNARTLARRFRRAFGGPRRRHWRSCGGLAGPPRR